MAEQALLDRLKRYSKKCLTERTDGDFADAVWEAVEVVDGLLNDLQEALDTIEELTGRNVGKWEEKLEPSGWGDMPCAECSACGEDFVLDDYGMDDIRKLFLYCPNCGARMDGE